MPDPDEHHFGAQNLDVSRETFNRLKIFESLVRRWTKTINLVSHNSVESLWTRHILDSVQVYEVAHPSAGHWVDIGSGAGFPGAVVAILAKQLAPDLHVTCVESDQRKAVFLRTVSRETECRFEVVAERIESVAPMNADFLSARALATLSNLLSFSDLHLGRSGISVFPKGETFASEVLEAQKIWRFDAERFTSRTDPKAVILKIGALTRA